MNQAPSPERMVKGATRILPFERVALVLQGGGALGAYQAGVYHALNEASIGVDWLCGTSIGAINGAIIAGNPPEKRVERLRDFWETVTTPPVRIPNIPWFTELAWNGNAHTRYWANRMSAFSTMLHGAPGFFSPRPLPPLNSAADSPEAVSYYDIAPLKKMLARLVDFDLINGDSMRFTVLATNVRSGARACFENREQEIGPAHILASASLPPSFPPTEIDWRIFLGWRRHLEFADAVCYRQSRAAHGAGFSGRSLGRKRRSAAGYSIRQPARHGDPQRQSHQHLA